MYKMLNDDGLMIPGDFDEETNNLFSFDKDDLNDLLKHLWL